VGRENVMAKFNTQLISICVEDGLWELLRPLQYESDIVGIVEVPAGFRTDFASVPRVPFIYDLYGDRAHYESVLHDYLYRIDSIPQVTFSQANDVFLEAMKVRGKSCLVSYGMYWGVVLGGYFSYHKRLVNDKLV
jgi:hypothetical protein